MGYDVVEKGHLTFEDQYPVLRIATKPGKKDLVFSKKYNNADYFVECGSSKRVYYIPFIANWYFNRMLKKHGYNEQVVTK